MDGAPKVTPGGAGPVRAVRGSPVTGVASADAAEVRASRVDVDEEGGLALQGYDCVSYHAPGAAAPLRGLPEHVVHTENVLQGRVRYQFATAENAERFRREHFSQNAPAYGGFCAEGVARGELKRADPTQWCLADDGRLFLFCGAEMRSAWEGKALTARRAAADAAWPKLAGGGDSRAAAA